MSIYEQLENKENFTEVEGIILDYLLQHRDEMAGVTITKVAGDTFSSNASVIRLCRKLGFDGFRELRLQIIKESERRRKTSKAVNMDYPIDEKDSLDDITGRISDLMVETLGVMKEQQLSNELRQAAALIKTAVHVYYGAGDVLLWVSYSGKSILSKERMHDLKRKGVKTILITAAKDVRGFDLQIRFPNREHYFDQKIATFYSQTAISYLLNCIYAIIYSNA